MLVKFLPLSSLVVQALNPSAKWGPGEHLLADLIDITALAHWKDPKPWPRPGDAEREQARIDARMAALEAQAARTAKRIREQREAT